jgi:hypothetical protein
MRGGAGRDRLGRRDPRLGGRGLRAGLQHRPGHHPVRAVLLPGGDPARIPVHQAPPPGRAAEIPRAGRRQVVRAA